MPDQANVHSLEAIEAFKAALVTFADRLEQGLVNNNAEMNRLVEWLEQDRPRYWKVQIRQAADEVNKAKADLERCLMYPVADERPACREERAALKKVQAQLAYCEQKAERLTHWRREFNRARFEYDGRISQLRGLIEIDAPHANGVLGKIIARLVEYQSLGTPKSRGDTFDTTLIAEIWPTGGTPDGDAAGAKPKKLAADSSVPPHDPSG
jgi:hypothetical protein